MAEMVLGAALGTAFTVLYDVVEEATVSRFKTVKPLVGALELTLASIQPLVIKQIGDYNVKLELPNDEVEKLEKQMREGEVLVCKLSKLAWWKRIKSRYIVQLVELDASLKGLMQHIVMQQARDIKENLLVAKQTAKQLLQFQEFNERLLQERMLLQEGAKEHQDRLVLQLQKDNGEQLLKLQRVIEDTMMLQEAREAIDTESGDLMGVAAVVKLFDVLYEKAELLTTKNVTYKHVLHLINSTLDNLHPTIRTMDCYRPLSYGEKRQIHRLATHVQDGIDLFRRCLKTGTWNIYRTLSNSNKLIQWAESIQRERNMMVEGQVPRNYAASATADCRFPLPSYT